ncbi:TetR/AcrR family transcriptional regulator [Nakamurella flava]|uniref:TetR/AcrR family transcriptional regulator n=1 Tax=Nakamurella flava TaxID=2576308 RepID=A0A4U6QBJ3_9ACTN|nr:TetR/AcrR family transcriptional regulator [Nakamurella flava]TKV57282.1 TetR/AcrR family transcriptional regulator [Nakamurella flava]
MPDPTSPRDETRIRIVTVAAELLERGGAAALTTRAVAQAAGVQAPTIYRLFGDKDGLLEAVAEHVMGAYVAGKAATVAAAVAAGVDPVEELRTAWFTQIRFGIEHPELHALMSDPERGRRSAAAQAGWQVLRERVVRVAAAGRLRVPVDRAIDMIGAAGNGAVLATLFRPPAERDPGLPAAMWEAVAAQILVAAADEGRSDGGALVAAISLRAAASELPALSDGERAVLVEWLDRVAIALATPPAS